MSHRARTPYAQGGYGEELLAGEGYRLETVAPDGRAVTSSASSSGTVTVKVISSGPAAAAILVEGVSAGSAVESWSLRLAQGARSFELNTTGSSTGSGGIVRHALSATPLAVFGYYPDDGVVQACARSRPCRSPAHPPAPR